MFAIIICKFMQFELISSSRPDPLPVQPASEHNIASIIIIYTTNVLLYAVLIHVYTHLQGLTQVEEMLISAIMPIMSIYRLPHGQYGYSGHVINLPQDVASFATSLPRLPSELDVIVVRKEGANQSHRDFRVRRSVVH